MKLKLFIYSSVITLIILLIVSANSRATENPSAREILNGNADADIIKIEGLIYSNVTDNNWVKEQAYQLGDKIGEIKKQTNRRWFYRDYFASTLPRGTALYIREGDKHEEGEIPSTVLVKKNDEILVYQAMIEG